ncbi:MAG: hypothetical protein AB7I24_08280 [Candidatus Nanopelagicales bacterium]
MTAGYTTPDAVKAWQDFWPILTALAVVTIWLWRRGRRWLRTFRNDFREDLRDDLLPELLEQITELIDEKTKPIQPESNGGKSLPDLHEKVDRLTDAIDNVQREQTNTNLVVLAHIANHRDPEPPERNPHG